jgi:hypothetical protein
MPACVSEKMKTNMEHWCNDTDRGKPKYWDEKRAQCHFVHHKYYWTDTGSSSGFQDERPETTRLMHATACLIVQIYI